MTSLPTLCALALTTLFWGMSFVWIKTALLQLPTFTLTLLRYGTGALLFAAIVFFRARLRKTRFHFTRRDHLRLAGLALLQPGIYFTCMTIGMHYSTASAASFKIATIPVVVLVFSAIFLREAVTPGKLLGIFLSVTGVGLLVTGGSGMEAGPNWLSDGWKADVLLFCAVVCGAGYTVLVRRLIQDHDPLAVSFLQFSYGSLYFLPFCLLEQPTMDWTAVDAHGLVSLACLTFLASFAAFFCYNYALSRVDAVRASVFVNMCPLVATVGAWYMLGETLAPVQMAGGGLILLSVIMPSLGDMRQLRHAPRTSHS